MKTTRRQWYTGKKRVRKSKTGMYRLCVKELLAERNMSMSKLSRLSDVAYNTIRRMVNEPEKDVSLSVLVRIAKALHVSLDQLVQLQ